MNEEKLKNALENCSSLNSELNHKVNTLYKLCKKYEAYFNTHNSNNKNILMHNSNGKSINSINDFDSLTYLTIPTALFIIDDKEED